MDLNPGLAGNQAKGNKPEHNKFSFGLHDVLPDTGSYQPQKLLLTYLHITYPVLGLPRALYIFNQKTNNDIDRDRIL